MRKLSDELGLPKLTFQVIRRTIATLGQKKGTPKDIQGVFAALAAIDHHGRLHAGDSPKREGDGGGHQQRTDAEAENGRSILEISGQFPAKRFEVGPLSY